MNCKYKNGIYSVERHTGNKANYLGIVISKEKQKIEIVSHIANPLSQTSTPISSEIILQEVISQWKISKIYFYIKEIHFYPNDSYEKGIYQFFTKKIVNYISLSQNILPKVEQDKYHKNLKVYRDLINSIDTAHEEGRVEGRIAGKIEGKIEGKLEEKIEIALTSLNQGLDIEIISKITGLSVEEIDGLRDV